MTVNFASLQQGFILEQWAPGSVCASLCTAVLGPCVCGAWWCVFQDCRSLMTCGKKRCVLWQQQGHQWVEFPSWLLCTGSIRRVGLSGWERAPDRPIQWARLSPKVVLRWRSCHTTPSCCSLVFLWNAVRTGRSWVATSGSASAAFPSWWGRWCLRWLPSVVSWVVRGVWDKQR